VSLLNRTFQEVAREIDFQERRALQALTLFGPTDEHLRETVEWHAERNSHDRYFLIRPDGRTYDDIPGIRVGQWAFSQKPAALRAAAKYPACRVYDMKDRKFVTA
jgi:hypothetical protein